MESHPTLGHLADNRSNNFRLIRHLAATSVLIAHSLGLLTPATSAPGLAWRIAGPASAIAVNVFFVASGFLVARSLLRRGDAVDFFLSRTLRIYPGLIVLVLLTAFVLGPTVTALPLRDYLTTRSVYGFVVWDSIMIVPDHFRYQLPGVFTAMQSRFGDTVNGSLWTLPWELWMYLSLFAAWKLRLLGRIFPVLFAAAALLFALLAPSGLDTEAASGIAIRFVAFFYAGVALYIYRERVPLTWPVLTAATAAFVAAWAAFGAPVLLPLWLSYTVLFAAYHPALVVRRWSEGPDYSYGIYIYAYPVQQSLIWATGVTSPVLHICLSLAVTTVLAAASWHWIESPALNLKKMFRNRAAQAKLAPAR